jgi:hypothetical protein
MVALVDPQRLVTTTSRLDLAAFMLEAVVSPGFVGKAVAIGSSPAAIRAAEQTAGSAAKTGISRS